MDNTAVSPSLHDAGAEPVNLSITRNAKIGLFHVGSSMADILAAGVWNRIAIAELGFAATPIALLLGLRYFLAPLAIWVGQRSDVSSWHGYRRLPFVWGGRFMMMISYFLLGFSTVNVADQRDSVIGWIGMIAALVLFSLGSAFSSTVYLALIHDITPRPQQTRTISVVWSFLIIGFAVSGVLYSLLLPKYNREGFLALFIIAPLIMGALWFVSLLGEEKPIKTAVAEPAVAPPQKSFIASLRAAWANSQTRIFFLFLALSTLFFYTQDSILEPFAAQVFGMEPRVTNRFSSYWGTMALIGIAVCLWLARRWPERFNNTNLSRIGVTILLISFAMFFVCAVAQVRPLVTIGLIVMGVGLGAWTVGTLGLMMDMTHAHGAGLYLSMWTVSETLARGVGTVLGGVLRDLTLNLSHQLATAYGTVFLLEAIGFAVTIVLLSRVDVAAFHRSVPSTDQVLEAAM